ncbi:MAG TPA: sigma-54 dependent transcriptional regulator [Steroidobacteraceae bacterium]|nr:sigma-54 dependent transcriptional regulator [Steroidobacteraceae bacterium]
MHGRTLLVIDDNDAVRTALDVLLTLEGARVEQAATPREGLERLARGGVDLVIQDMTFQREVTSGREGIELFRAIRAAHPDMPVVLMTAWTSLETAVELVKAGAADYLAKPWDNSRLVTTVRNLLQLRAVLDVERERRQRLDRSRDELANRFDLRDIVYRSDALHAVVQTATQVARADIPVLITGPNGAGKEIVAEIIQANSAARDGPFVKVNAGALPSELLESELFGAESGAYTGARTREGRFEAANGGTLFLDEIGNLPLPGQAKLLRVLQTGEFERLGSSQTRRVRVRIISATNTSLLEAIRQGLFREDLYYRLNVIELRVPPLAERRDDVPPLAHHFLEPGYELTPEAERALLRHDWPGNVRELRNCIRRACLLAGSHRIGPPDLMLPSGAGLASAGEMPPAREPDRAEIEGALARHQGVVAKAARDLGLTRQSLYRRMEKLGIAASSPEGR